MAKKSTSENAPDEPQKVAVRAAKAIGKVAGKVAATVTEASPAHVGATRPKRKAGKLVSKNKSRLPRRQKKARKRREAKQLS